MPSAPETPLLSPRGLPRLDLDTGRYATTTGWRPEVTIVKKRMESRSTSSEFSIALEICESKDWMVNMKDLRPIHLLPEIAPADINLGPEGAS